MNTSRYVSVSSGARLPVFMSRTVGFVGDRPVGFFVDIGTFVNGKENLLTRPSIKWNRLFEWVKTDVLRLDPEHPITSMSFYFVSAPAEIDEAARLKKQTGTEAIASSVDKNDTDMNLAMEARDFMEQNRTNGGGDLVLFAGDCDYSRLVKTAAENGFTPYVVGPDGSISRQLRNLVARLGGTCCHSDPFTELRSSPFTLGAKTSKARTVKKNATTVAMPEADVEELEAALDALSDSDDDEIVSASTETHEATAPAPLPINEATAEEIGRIESAVAEGKVRPVSDDEAKLMLGDNADYKRLILKNLVGLWRNGRLTSFSGTVRYQSERLLVPATELHVMIEELLERDFLYQETVELKGARSFRALIPTRDGIVLSL